MEGEKMVLNLISLNFKDKNSKNAENKDSGAEDHNI